MDLMSSSESEDETINQKNMKQLIVDITKFALIAAAILAVGLQLANSYRQSVYNQAIDGCAAATFYQSQFKDAEGRDVTVREPQKTQYQDCLKAKGIVLRK